MGSLPKKLQVILCAHCPYLWITGEIKLSMLIFSDYIDDYIVLVYKVEGSKIAKYKKVLWEIKKWLPFIMYCPAILCLPVDGILRLRAWYYLTQLRNINYYFKPSNLAANLSHKVDTQHFQAQARWTAEWEIMVVACMMTANSETAGYQFSSPTELLSVSVV